MNKEYLINFLRENLTIIKSYGVTSLALFGSFARDEAKTTSDLDLLVEFQGKVTFDQYMDDLKKGTIPKQVVKVWTGR